MAPNLQIRPSTAPLSRRFYFNDASGDALVNYALKNTIKLQVKTACSIKPTETIA